MREEDDFAYAKSTEPDRPQTEQAAGVAMLALVMFACLVFGIIIGSWIPYLTR